jgi:signal peptidase I
MAFGRDRRDTTEQAEDVGFLAGLWETVKTVFWALLIAGVFRSLLLQPFWIPSGSMKDTLLIGDFLFVNKMAYGYSYASCPSIPFTGIDAQDICGFPRRRQLPASGANARAGGDVVVFRHPVTGEDYIKRLIGLPGDRIESRAAAVINRRRAPARRARRAGSRRPTRRRDPTALSCPAWGGASGRGQPCPADRYIGRCPRVSHDILDLGSTPGDNTRGVFTVPEGHFFFMGDNRDDSLDSRFPQAERGVGFVPFENLVGRADRVMFSSAGRSMLAFWTWRPDRFFHAID